MSNDDRVQYKFMIPSALKERIEDAAHENRRSLSAEIVATLEEKYPAPEPGEESYAEVMRWSDRITAAKDESESQRLLSEANKWLTGPGNSDYRIFLFKPSAAGRWLPSIVHKDAIGSDGLPEAFYFKTPPSDDTP